MSQNKTNPMLDNLNSSAIKSACCYYRTMLKATMTLIVTRADKNINYPWIDTKIDILTGKDFDEKDFYKGPNTVYGWIQGRGLEAITEHTEWLKKTETNSELIEKLETLIAQIYHTLTVSRKKNNDHLSFLIDPTGKAFKPDDNNRPRPLKRDELTDYNYSDLFCSKGLYRAACYLQDSSKIIESSKYLKNVISAIWQGSFISDQISFRGKISGADSILNSLGPYMLALGGLNILISEEPEYSAEQAFQIFEHIISRHVNTEGNWNFGKPFDCIENVDNSGNPEITGGTAESDPGHSLEFVGLGLKFLNRLSRTPVYNSYRKRAVNFENILTKMLFRNFENGFITPPGGICKLYDLISRQPVNDDMPWWSLPETMRAACFAANASNDNNLSRKCMQIYLLCHNSFVENFVQPDNHYLAIQTLDSSGSAKPVIPATPDADPGYHTGLSLLDCLEQLGCISI